MDPGAAYYQVTYSLTLATQRSLMGWPPHATQPVPDLADGQPKVTDGGKTITFAIRPGVHYSPPVDRAVKAQDVKYAIERTLLPGVPNGYVRTYLDGVVGFQQAENQAKADKLTAPNISGITTPDDHTLVIKLTNTSAAPVIQALSLPMSVPVPEEYAKKFDAQSPSGYEQYVTFTGPYMVQNDCDVEGRQLDARRQGAELQLHRQAHGLPAGQGDPDDPEPELDWLQGGRLPSGVPGRHRHPGGLQRSDVGFGEDPLGQRPGQRRLPALEDGRAAGSHGIEVLEGPDGRRAVGR